MLLEYTSLTDAVKHKALQKRKRFYYVFFVGTLHKHRGKGKPRPHLPVDISYSPQLTLTLLKPSRIVISPYPAYPGTSCA